MTDNFPSSTSLLGRGVIMLILGLLILLLPLFSAWLLEIIIKIAVLFFGISLISMAFSPLVFAEKTWVKILLVILGLALVVIGILSFFMPSVVTLFILGIILGIAALMISVPELAAAIAGKELPTAARVISGICGVLGILIAAMLFASPVTGFLSVEYVAGIFLLVFGIFGIIEALVFKGQKPAE